MTCRGCGRETRGNLCPVCQRDFDRGDPNGPLRELDDESDRARGFEGSSNEETDDWTKGA